MDNLNLTESDLWLSGFSMHYPDPNKLDTRLRLNPWNPEQVQTSSGAIVPTSVCRRLWVAFSDCQIPEDSSVGNFQLETVDERGLRIGCNFIKASEIKRFASVLWGDDCLQNKQKQQ